MTERKMFEEYLFSTEKFKFRNKAFLFMLDENGEYEDQPVLEHWKTWQAATQREGFKFVPVEPTVEMVKAYYSTQKPTAVRCYKAMVGVIDK